MTPNLSDQSVLPPTQPPDPPGTRPKLDLAHMIRQVLGVQIVCWLVWQAEKK